MIIISGEWRIKPELREEALVELKRMATASQAEADCVAYQFYAHLEDPATFFTFEAWETAAALAAHGQTSHMAAFRAAIPRLTDETPSLQRYHAEPAT